MADRNYGSLKRKRSNDGEEPYRPDNQEQWKPVSREEESPGVEHSKKQRACPRSDFQESTVFDTTINRDSKASNGLGRLAILPQELRNDIYRFVLLEANDVPEVGSRCPPALLHSISNEVRNEPHGIRLDLNCTHTTFALTCTDGAVRDSAHEWTSGRLKPDA